MPIGTIASVIVAYVVIAVLLLSLNLTSRWRWWIKAGAILVTGAFFVGSALAILSLLGWPTREEPPAQFSLIASRVVEPDKVSGEPGVIFLWLETLDENNVPSGQPRSYSLGYSSALAQSIGKAQDMLDNGDDVKGSFLPPLTPEQLAEAEQTLGGPPEGDQQRTGTAFEAPDQNSLVFNDMPPVRLPDKGVL